MGMNAEDLVKLLRKKYRTNDGGYNPCVILEQVPDGTSLHQGRWIDVAVFQMWTTKGLSRSAFEIKVSRPDFLNELGHPEKHQWCKECFHQFWFVAPRDVIQIEELPAGVGWMYPRGEKLCIARHAVPNPTPKLDDVLLAGFMRAAYKGIESAKEQATRDILDNSLEYQHAKWYMEATMKFLESRGSYGNLIESVDNIRKALEEATIDKQLKQEREHLLAISDKFQRDVAGLLNLFLVIAHKSLVARDKMGKLIVETYGGNDDAALEVLKGIAKSSKASNYQKRYVELIDTMLHWEDVSPTR